MKLFLFLVIACTMLAFSQTRTTGTFVKDTVGVTVTDTVKTILNKQFYTGFIDTTRALDVSKAQDFWVSVSSRDSSNIYISYQVAVRNARPSSTVWSRAILFDSVTTTNNAGTYAAKDMSSVARGTQWLRIIFSQSPYSTIGKSTPTYDANYSRIE